MSELFIETWGSGTPVVLLHGSLATGADEWAAQKPLAGEGFRLLVPDRRGYGNSPAAEGEDFMRDADDIVEAIGDGAHLVGHSYGALSAMVAAAQRPESVRSLTLLEPPAFAAAPEDPAAQTLHDDVRALWNEDAAPDDDWLVRFLAAVGADPDDLPPGALEQMVPLVPVLRHGRPAWDHVPPVASLATGRFPKLVVSGDHNQGFEAICDRLADQIGATRSVIQGAGHEIQFTGPPLNQRLLEHWRQAD